MRPLLNTDINLQVEVRTGVRVEPEVQGRQVHHRAGAHDQGERLGERELRRREKTLHFISCWSHRRLGVNWEH